MVAGVELELWKYGEILAVTSCAELNGGKTSSLSLVYMSMARVTCLAWLSAAADWAAFFAEEKTGSRTAARNTEQIQSEPKAATKTQIKTGLFPVDGAPAGGA